MNVQLLSTRNYLKVRELVKENLSKAFNSSSPEDQEGKYYGYEEAMNSELEDLSDLIGPDNVKKILEDERRTK